MPLSGFPAGGLMATPMAALRGARPSRLRFFGESDVLATVNDFELIQGAGNDGAWRSRTAVTLPEGRVAVDVEGTTTSGYHRTTADAGLIDNGR